MEQVWLKHYSDEAISKQVSDSEITCYEMLARTAALSPDKTAILCDSGKLTFADLLGKIDVVSKSFQCLGIKKGDVVAIYMNTSVESITCFYALNKIGAISFLLNSMHSTSVVEMCIERTNPKLIVASEADLKRLLGVINKSDNIIAIVCESSKLGFFSRYRSWVCSEKSRVLTWRGFVNLGVSSPLEKQASASTTNEPSNDEPSNMENDSEMVDVTMKAYADDPTLMIFSGASIGVRSIAVFNSVALNTKAHNCNISFVQFARIPSDEFEKRAVVLSVTELSNGFGIAFSVHMMLANALTIVIPSGYDGKSVAKAIRKFQPNIFVAYPTWMYEEAENPVMKNIDLSCIKIVIAGGSKFPPLQKQKVEEFLKDHGSDAVIQVGYGLSELLSLCTITPPNKYSSKSVGIPFLGTMIKIVNPETQEELPFGAQGEICICSPSQLMCFYGESEQTDCLIRRHRDGRYWVHTGDNGYLDEDGYLYYCGSNKRSVKVRDITVFPTVAEEAIAGVVGVSEVVVIPREKNGETYLHAIVAPDESLLFDEEALSELKARIFAECESMLLPYTRPKSIEYKVYLPRNHRGEIDYRKVMEEDLKADSDA